MAAPTAKYRIYGVRHAAVQKSDGGTPEAIVERDIKQINNVAFDVQQSDISWEGDNESVRKFFLNGIVVTVAADVFDLAVIAETFGKDEIITGLPTGVDGRTYFGDSSETAGVRTGFVAEVDAENIVSNATDTLRLVVPVAIVTIVRPPTLAYQTKAGTSMTFTAEKTENDIVGEALPSVPSGGAYWYIDRISP